MKLSSFLDYLASSKEFNECKTPQQRVVFMLQTLNKVDTNCEFIEGDTLESAFEEVSIRYREIKLDKNFDKFDFGLIAVICPDTNEYKVLTKLNGLVECITIKDDVLKPTVINNEQLIVADNETAYEVYPSLPYFLQDIAQFLEFTFSEFQPDLLKLTFFTVLSQCIKAAFPLITVYVTTTIVSLGSINLTLQIGTLTFLLSFLAILSLYLQTRVITKLESESDKRAQTAVWDRLMKIDLSYISPYGAADLVSRAASIGQVRTLLSSQNITSFISLLFSIVYLFEMYSYLPLATLSVLPLLFLFVFFVVTKARTGGALLTGSLTANAELTDISNNILRGYVELSSAGALYNAKRQWINTLKESADFSYRYRQKDNSLDVLSNTFMSLGFLVSFVTIISFSSGQLSQPNFLPNAIGYTSALTIFCSTLSAGTVSIVNSFINVLAYWKRATPIVFSPIEAGYNSSCYPVNLEGDIEVDSITFSYSPSLPNVLNSFSLIIYKNQLNIVSIPAGNGTSTFFRILLGLYPITSGSIHFDSHKSSNILLSSLRSQLKLAPQNLNIPNGNFFRVFKGPLASDDVMLSKFVDAFGLTKFINSQRMGIDTPLSNNGKNLPEKVRQLLSLAYACCEKPKIILVDNCLTELEIKEKACIFNYLLKNDFTIVLSDVDSNAIKEAMQLSAATSQ